MCNELHKKRAGQRVTFPMSGPFSCPKAPKCEKWPGASGARRARFFKTIWKNVCSNHALHAPFSGLGQEGHLILSFIFFSQKNLPHPFFTSRAGFSKFSPKEYIVALLAPFVNFLKELLGGQNHGFRPFHASQTARPGPNNPRRIAFP